MGYNKKLVLLIAIDIFIVWLSIFSSYYINFLGNDTLPHYTRLCFTYGFVSSIVCTCTLFGFKLYRYVWQYASVEEMVAIVKAVVSGTIISYSLTFILTSHGVPLDTLVTSFENMLILLGGTRFLARVYQNSRGSKARTGARTLIIGAGSCGSLVARKLKMASVVKWIPVAFIDDDKLKHKQEIYGVPIYGDRNRIAEAVKVLRIEEIIIAMPSVSQKEVGKIIDICKPLNTRLKIIPLFDDLLAGKLMNSDIRNVEVEDLLGRETVKLDMESIAGYLLGKTVLVTGAGGSIGSELCRQIARFHPEMLLLVGHGENSIYSIDAELGEAFPELRKSAIIADIKDVERMSKIFANYRPQVVFHAAAHKHVPLMEQAPDEAVKNNVFGTKNVSDCAHRFGTERFILISTDKAVNPTSIMGATKRIAEMYIQSLNNISSTKFAAVRLGNVLGSRGSVIPLFKRQIAKGGPVTVTHPDMFRYFMTIPEAAQLIIQAGAFTKGGEVFILDMEKPVKIVDLAKDLIRLSGYQHQDDIQITFTGIRPGEKLYEELLTSEEGLTATLHQRIFVGKSANLCRASLDFAIKQLEKAVNEDRSLVRERLKQLVPTYQESSSIRKSI